MALKHKIGYAASVLFIISSGVSASMLEEALKINGFATFGASTVDSKNVEFKAYNDQRDGVEQGEVDLATNSLFGLQARYELSESGSVTAQGVVRKKYRDFEPSLEWLYYTYSYEDILDFRIGRFRIPYLKSSELAYVNFSRVYARNPVETYSVGGFTHHNGIELLHNRRFGDYELSLQGTTGFSEKERAYFSEAAEYLESKAIKMVSTSINSELFRTTMTLSDIDGKYYNNASSINQKLQAASLETQLKIFNFDILGGVTYLKTSGAQTQFKAPNGFKEKDSAIRKKPPMNPGALEGKELNKIPDNRVQYISLSYNLNKFTPFMLFSRDEMFIDIVGPDGKNSEVTTLKEDDLAFGFRYDLSEKMALKFQLDTITPRDTGGLANLKNESQKRFNVYTLTIDTVF